MKKRSKRRTGLPSKYAKMGFAKGWKKYKASKKKKRVINPSKKRGTAMARRKKRTAGKAVRVYVKNPRRRRYRRRYRRNPAMFKGFTQALAPMLAGAMGSVGMNLLLSRIPMIPPKWRGATKLGIGALMITQKNQFIRWAGIVIGALAIKDILVNFVPALAGDEITDSDIEQIDNYVNEEMMADNAELMADNEELMEDNYDLMGDSLDPIVIDDEMDGEYLQHERTMDMID